MVAMKIKAELSVEQDLAHDREVEEIKDRLDKLTDVIESLQKTIIEETWEQ
jgi:hypothetical protein